MIPGKVRLIDSPHNTFLCSMSSTQYSLPYLSSLMSNLLQRVLVAIVGVPVLVWLVLIGGFPFMVFVAIVSLIAQWEFYKMGEIKGAIPSVRVALSVSVVLQAAATLFDRPHLFLPVVAFCSLVILTAELFRNKPNALLNVSVSLAGIFYVGIFFLCLSALRHFYQFQPISTSSRLGLTPHFDWGGYFVLTMFCAIWVCDSGAYFAGRAFGKHKFFERVSPKKTWEGAVVGGVASVIVFFGMAQWLMPEFGSTHSILCGLMVGTVAQLGDLAKSLLKRDAGIKDSSNILPGHGGILDRFDSILFVSPALLLYLSIVAWW